MRKRRVAVVGATGIAGQQALVALADHPWFEVTTVAASARTAGRPYRDAIRDKSGARQWWCREEPSEAVLDLRVVDASTLDPGSVDLVFSLIESDAARELEPRFARAVPTLSSASAYRYEPDVPIIVPGVNMVSHLPLIEHQRRQRGWKGYLLPQSNCTVVGLVVSLKPLVDAFGVRRVLLTTMQGISGAGRAGGVLGLDMLDNLIPYIPKEEEKVAAEAGKILGRLVRGRHRAVPRAGRRHLHARRGDRRAHRRGHDRDRAALRSGRGGRGDARLPGRLRWARPSERTATAHHRPRRSRSVRSPGSIATPRAAWRPASGGCDRSPR